MSTSASVSTISKVLSPTAASSSRVDGNVRFKGAAVGGYKYSLPKTGLPDIDVEVAIITRCLDRLLAPRLAPNALPPPNTTRSALTPFTAPLGRLPASAVPPIATATAPTATTLNSGFPPVASTAPKNGIEPLNNPFLMVNPGMEEAYGDPSILFNADGTIRRKDVDLTMSSTARSPTAAVLPGPTSTSTSSPIKSPTMGSSGGGGSTTAAAGTGLDGDGKYPNLIYKTTIDREDVETEVRIVRRSLANIINTFAVIAQNLPLDSPLSPKGRKRPAKKTASPMPSPMPPPADSSLMDSIANASSMSMSRSTTASAQPPPPSAAGGPPQPTQPSLESPSKRPDISTATALSVVSPTSARTPRDEDDIPIDEIIEDNSFWGVLSRYCRYGVGSYQFDLAEVGSRLVLAEQSKQYGLAVLSESLFQFTACVFSSKEVRYYVRGPSVVNKLKLQKESRTSYISEIHAKDPPGLALDGSRTAGRHCRGIIHYIGTLYGSKPWRNPAAMGYPHPLMDVRVSSSFTTAHPADILHSEMVYFATQDKPNSWILMDFGHHLIIPKCYSFSSAHPIYAGYYPRNWEFQGSCDGENWTCLKRHIDDQTINRYNPIGYWLIEGTIDTVRTANTTPYSMFRILQIGPNSFGTNELQCSAFEIYGQLIYLAEPILAPAPPDARIEEHTREPDCPPDPPPMPKPPKKKGQKK